MTNGLTNDDGNERLETGDLKTENRRLKTMSKSRVIVLTGATQGLGRAMAVRLMEAGHVVAGCGRSAVAIESLTEQFGEPHRFRVVDVAQDDRVAQWAEDVLGTLGPPDLLINNAAVINRNAPVWEVPEEEFSRVIDINIKGVANVIRHFVPAMVKRQKGVIVNFSSGWGRSTSAEVAPYCATKFAIEGLTQSLAQELPQGMAAVPFNPGVINTDMLQSCFGGGADNYPSAELWSHTAVPYLLSLGPKHNGQSLSAPM
jgi:NAD(P)-dependent dehydrogenase (short-subunit alcohol dehydrogenase family)